MKKNNIKLLSVILSLLMIVTVIAPYSDIVNAEGANSAATQTEEQKTNAVNTSDNKESKEATPTENTAEATPADSKLELNGKEIYLTEKGDIKVTVTLKKPVAKAADLSWTLGGKPLTDWKSFTKTDSQDENWKPEATEGYSGAPWLSIKDVKINGNQVTATLHHDLPFGVDTVDNRPFPRWTFMNLVGEKDFKVTDNATGETAATNVNIKAYQGYYQYDELKPRVDTLINEANQKGNMYAEYQAFGHSAAGRALHGIIIAKDKNSIDNYLNNTAKMALNNPQELINKIKSGQLKTTDYKLPIMVSTPHPDEHPAVDSQMRTIETLIKNDTITFKDPQDKNKNINMKVSDVLDNFILVFDLTENPDGRYYNLRHNANGFDLNRDNIYQVQPEAQGLTSQMAKWHPLMFLDLHGFVKEFLIEPCTPPHEPNFEYDLLMGGVNKNTKGIDKFAVKYGPGAIENAKAMGSTAVANTKYNSFIIPMFDYGDGWDDAFLGYTGVFSLIHGALGHTIEIPDSNTHSVNAHMYTILGAINYAMHNKEALYLNQLEIFNRGIKNEDNRNVDTWAIDPQGKEIGRPRGNNANFFPEYYILPMDEKQTNKLEVYKMINYYLRNGIKVEKSTEPVTYNGKTYPAGSIIVPMHQAERGYANMTLYDGVDQSGWGAMYAEVVLDFPAMKGFSKVEVRQKGLFDGKTSEITQPVKIPGTEVNVNSQNLVIKNDNIDTVKAVNDLLNSAKKVAQVVKTNGNAKAGDFVVSTNDFKTIADKYYVNIEAAENGLETKDLVMPKVYITPTNSDYASLTDHTRYVVKELGFKVVDNINDANTIVDSSGKITKDQIANKNYIAIGSAAINGQKAAGIYQVEIQNTGAGHEGLLRAYYNKDSVITGSYNPTDYAYIADGTVMRKVPQTAKILAKVPQTKDFYKSGWWPGHDAIKGATLAVVDKVDNSNIALFAEDLTNKAYTTHLFRLMTNAIYAVNNDTSYEPVKENNNAPMTVNKEYKNIKSVNANFTDTQKHWAKPAIDYVATAKIFNGVGNNKFAPDTKINKAMLTTLLYRLADKPIENKFAGIKDAQLQDYYYDAANWAAAEKIAAMNTDKFEGNKDLTRAEVAKMLAQYVNVLGLKFDTKDTQVSDIANLDQDTQTAINTILKTGVMKGKGNNKFDPNGQITRAEMAQIIQNIITMMK